MEPIDQLMQEIVHTIGDEPGPVRVARQRRAVDRLFQAGLARRGPLWLTIPAVATVVTLLVVWFGRGVKPDVPPTVTRDERPFAAESWLRAEREPLALEFPDRSRIELAPGSLAQWARTDFAHTQLNLEHGRLELRVAPGGERVWLVVAGPYTVEVSGATFTVDWQPQALTTTVAVREGSVRVRGGALGDSTLLTPGQQLSFSGPASSSIRTATIETPRARCEPPDCLSPKGASPQRRARVGWRELAAQGEHARALAAAKTDGLATLIAELSADDLERLAHSARLARAAAPAREALRSLYRRFPAAAREKGTAFLLGRVALELDADSTTAATWFETYLREQPHGDLAEEARERLLTIRRTGGEPARAEAAARDYLQHHPTGRSAAIARRILESQ